MILEYQSGCCDERTFVGSEIAACFRLVVKLQSVKAVVKHLCRYIFPAKDENLYMSNTNMMQYSLRQRERSRGKEREKEKSQEGQTDTVNGERDGMKNNEMWAF